MRFRKRKGLTLIEVILSIVLLGIISVSILPMSIHAVKFAKWNNIRQNAMNMAYTQIEWLKTLDYHSELELKGRYFPPDKSNVAKEGFVEEGLFVNEINTNPKKLDGIEYRFLTNIYWESGTSSTGKPVPNALRKVDVTVWARDPFSGDEKEYSVIGTLIAFEGERAPNKYPPLKIIAHHGPKLVKNVKFELFKELGDYAINWSRTDEKGEAIFVELIPGKYRIEAKEWQKGKIMSKPNLIRGIESEQRWGSNYLVEINGDIYSEEELNVDVDLPGYINLCSIPENAIKNSIIRLYPNNIEPTLEITTQLNNLNDLEFWREWTYENDVDYDDTIYKLIEKDTNELWDGKFEYDSDNTSTKDLTLGYIIEESINNIYTIEDNKIVSLRIVLPVSLNKRDIEGDSSMLRFFLYNGDEEIEFEVNNVRSIGKTLNEYQIDIHTEYSGVYNGEIRLKFKESILDRNGIGMVKDSSIRLLDKNN